MEINQKRVVEIFLAIILVIVLIILILLFTSQSITGKPVSTVSNSYNTNSYNTNSYNRYSLSQPSPPLKLYDSTKHMRYYKPYDPYPTYYLKDRKYLTYKSGAEQRRVVGLLGNDIDKYAVYVKNTDHMGGYFTVRFYFKDYYGQVITKSATHYVKPYEERAFLYKDIYADRYKHHDWTYEVISQTRIPGEYYLKSPRIIYAN